MIVIESNVDGSVRVFTDGEQDVIFIHPGVHGLGFPPTFKPDVIPISKMPKKYANLIRRRYKDVQQWNTGNPESGKANR